MAAASPTAITRSLLPAVSVHACLNLPVTLLAGSARLRAIWAAIAMSPSSAAYNTSGEEAEILPVCQRHGLGTLQGSCCVESDDGRRHG